MRFSVIIPVYNKASSIRRTLESIFSQTYKDFEIIVVDDGSQDNLCQVLQIFQQQIRVIHQENMGVSVARNCGIDQSKGDFICFLDADDTWFPDHLAILSDALEAHPQAKFLSTMFLSSFEGGIIRSKLPLLEKYNERIWLDDYIKVVLDTSSTIIHTSTVCIHKSILQNMRFEPGEKIGEDTDLWYRVATYYPLLLIKRETAVYHRELSTASMRGNNNLDWAFARREERLTSDTSISFNKRRNIHLLLDRWRCTCCRQLLCEGKRSEAVGYLTKVRYPLQKRVCFCWILCCLPASILKRIMNKNRR